MEPVDHAVHGQLLAARPDILDDGRLTHVHRLLDHVELAEPVEPLLLRGLRELRGVLLAHVHHVAEPVVDQPEAEPRATR